MNIQNQKYLGTALVLLGTIAGASGQVLYSDNFDSGLSGANWTVNNPSSTANNAANFAFDYSTIGIPSAPNAGGTTVGLKMEANFSAGTPTTANGLSVSPTGKSFAGDFVLKFDMWQNFNGPAPGGGSGSTQMGGAGVGTSGTTAQYMNGTQTSIWFAQTGDGGNGTSTQDYHAYSSASGSGVGYTAASGVFAAGTGVTAIDNANAYYAALGGHTAPSAQTTLFAQQTGAAAAGAPAFAWHQVTLTKLGTTVTYTIDSTLIATILNINSLTLSGDDIEFVQNDVNTTLSTDVNRRALQFLLIDDVVVMAPEPSAYLLGLLGAAGFFIFRRRAK